MCMLPAHLASWNRYHTRGILLPFGTMDDQFTTPNRVRYCRSLKFITRYSNDVLCGWDVLKVISSGVKHGASDEDLYGCLFFHIREIMLIFLQKLKDCCIELCLTQSSARNLAEILHQAKISFHRIDACSLAHEYSTIKSNYSSPDISSVLADAAISIEEVHGLLKKLLLLGFKNSYSEPKQWALLETVHILGRLLEKDASRGFRSHLLTALLDWVTKVPSASCFLQEQESEMILKQESLRRESDVLFQKFRGKWVYSGKISPDHGENIACLIYPYANPRIGMLSSDALHEDHFKPYLSRLIAKEEVEKSGLEVITHSHMILPRSSSGLMTWRSLLESGWAPHDDLEKLLREYPRQLYYTVLFAGLTCLEEFQEWGWKSMAGSSTQ